MTQEAINRMGTINTLIECYGYEALSEEDKAFKKRFSRACSIENRLGQSKLHVKDMAFGGMNTAKK